MQQSDQQPAIRGAADEYEDKDGDVVMAEEDVEQLVASLQAARHASSEWENMGGPSSISMLLFGCQVTYLQCCQGPNKDPALFSTLLHALLRVQQRVTCQPYTRDTYCKDCCSDVVKNSDLLLGDIYITAS